MRDSSPAASNIQLKKAPRLEYAHILPTQNGGLSLNMQFSGTHEDSVAINDALKLQAHNFFIDTDASSGFISAHIKVKNAQQAEQVAAQLHKAIKFRLRLVRLEACAGMDERELDGPYDVLVDVQARKDKRNEENIAGDLCAAVLRENIGKTFEVLIDGEDKSHFQLLDKSGPANTQTAAMLRAERLVRRIESDFGIGVAQSGVRLVDIYYDNQQAKKQGICARLRADSEKALDKLLMTVKRKYRGSFSELSRDTAKHEVVLGTYYNTEPDLAHMVSLLHIGLNCELPVRVEGGAQQNAKGFHPCLVISPAQDAGRHKGLLAEAMARYISALVPAAHGLGGGDGIRHLVLDQTCPDEAEAKRWAEGLRKRVEEKLVVGTGLPGRK
ncbi:MAG: hypothetical protein EBV03_06125 [Proteobacteria bacterium]|nr:hypothetical protein [Pseudomonadota bacterium]